MRRRVKKRKEKNVKNRVDDTIEGAFDILDIVGLLFRPIVWVLKGIFKLFD